MVRISESDFQVWLDQNVWVSDCEKGTRREWIPAFAEALTGWMKEMGYTMSPSWKLGHRVVAYWLYVVHCVHLSSPEDTRLSKYYKYYNTHRNWPEDRDYFQITITSDTITDFLESWICVEDLDPTVPLGQKIEVELQEFLYTWIDPDLSKQGEKVGRWFGETSSESEEDTSKAKARGVQKKDVDIYIVEARQGLHGGRGSKV